MKQHITVEQLSELSDDGKEKLREWWNPSEFDLYFDGSEPDAWGIEYDDVISFDDDKKETKLFDSKISRKALPLLSIGQMIELVLDKEFNLLVPGVLTLTGYGLDVLNGDKLCDALWEAVKEVLNDK